MKDACRRDFGREVYARGKIRPQGPGVTATAKSRVVSTALTSNVRMTIAVDYSEVFLAYLSNGNLETKAKMPPHQEFPRDSINVQYPPLHIIVTSTVLDSSTRKAMNLGTRRYRKSV